MCSGGAAALVGNIPSTKSEDPLADEEVGIFKKSKEKRLAYMVILE